MASNMVTPIESKTTERRKRFARIYPKRLKKIKESIIILGNCSNKRSYEYPKEQVKKSLIALAQVLVQQARKFDLNLDIMYNDNPVETIDLRFKLEEVND